MTNWYIFGGRHFLDGTFHCCFATVKFLVDCETRVHHILSSRQQQIQLEAEKKRWFSPAEAWISVCHITEDIQAPVLHWAALPGQEMLFSRRSSTKELVNLVTSRIVPVALWRNKKRTERSCSWCKVWSGHLSPLEPAGAGAGRVSPILFGLCLLCVVTWTCSSVFMEVFSENLFQGLPGGHSDPRGTWCGSALLRPSESPFGYVHSLLRLRRNGVLHIWVQTSVLCSVTGGKENIIVLS